MSLQDLEKLVHAFIFSRLDYRNSVFKGLSKKTTRPHVSSQTRRDNHIHEISCLPPFSQADSNDLYTDKQSKKQLLPQAVDKLLKP